ncbi:MAG TPA: thiosulfate oxidation carrier protein SoxY [Rhodocyclaceae bacterium]|nr:thiosulfate oxidation carrier protein SoxY [Rhodocyclaceae bacterium]HNH35301.1 thiosulfate oxidation carrier protein SoxY [Rhodocyclaceae bacterium]
MDTIRRQLLKGAGATGALAAALAAGLLKPTQVLANEWNRAAFEAKESPAVLKALGAGSSSDSKDLLLKAPDIAENGAVVPVDVVSNIPNTISIAILVDKNPFPLSAAFDFASGAMPEMSVRLKLGQTSVVKAVAKTADGKYYTVQKEVKVTVGGCGG